MRLGSLCTGYGGLDMAAHALFPDAELVFVSDNDKHVTQLLDQRYPNVRNLGDFTQLDRLPDCDILTAGFPCQPVSAAGKRKGTADDRWLWDDIERVLGGMERPPGLLLLENVRGLLSANGGDAMARVVEGLAGLGYVGRYRVLAASDVGAPHRRERVFIVAAHPEDADGRATTGKRRHPSGEHLVSTQWAEGRGVGVRHSASAADSDDGRRQQCDEGERHVHLSEQRDLQPRFGPYAAAVARWEQVIGRPAPEPTVSNTTGGVHPQGAEGDGGEPPVVGTWPRTGRGVDSGTTAARVQELGRGAGVARRLNPRFVEWMMGLPDGWVTNPDLGLSRTAQLKMLGNGVVPQQAHAAYRSLL